MHDRYPITGIKQSYRKDPGRRTVVIPVLMGAVMLGIIAFFYWTEPVREFDPASIPEVVVEEEELPKEVIRRLTFAESVVEKGEPTVVVPQDITEEAEVEEIPEPENVVRIDEQKFTPWLSPIALDTYIRQKNEGFEESFWERGHWIKAVEGRWADGNHEFRIAFEPVPNPDTWQWQYRVNQTQSEFATSIKEMSQRGYKLYQTQSYPRPDGTRRFQGVWQREVQDLPTMVGNATESTESSQ